MSAVLGLQLIDQDMMVNKKWSSGGSFIEIDDTELGQEVILYGAQRVGWDFVFTGPIGINLL